MSDVEPHAHEAWRANRVAENAGHPPPHQREVLMSSTAGERDATFGSDPTQPRSAAAVLSTGGQAVTVLLSGELDHSAVAAMNNAFTRAMSTEATVVVVDATAVTFCNFDGAAALVLMSLHCRDSARELRFLPSKSVQRKLRALGLASLSPLAPVRQ